MTLDKKRIPYRSYYPTPVVFNTRTSKLGRTRKAKLNRIIDAYLFFRANAGGIVGENAKGALAMARAERYAMEHNWEYYWEDDPEGCIGADCGETESCDHACCQGKPHTCLHCQLVTPAGTVLASLGSICEPTYKYRRVVEAELALEAMPVVTPKGHRLHVA